MTRSIFQFRDSSFLIYGIAAGLSRAGGLLAVPVAAHALSLAEIGAYAMGMVLVQVLSQILSLGGGVAVAREGAANTASARALALQFSLLALSLAIPLAVLGSLLPIDSYWALFIFLAAHEAAHQLIQLALRAEDRAIAFLVFAVIKTFSWVLIASLLVNLAPRNDWSIQTWLTLQLAVYSLISILFIVSRNKQRAPDGDRKAQWLLHHLPYCLPLIIHGLAQWVLSSSDKLIVGAILGNEKLAIYSLAYTVASVMSVLLSGLGLYLPHEVMKHKDKWSSPSFRFEFIKKYTIGYCLAFTVLLIGFFIDYGFIGLLKHYHFFMPLIIGSVCTGLLCLGIYQVYVCFLFGAKATGEITKITLLVSLAYLVFLLPFVYLFDIVGAAFATLLAYAFYMHAVRKAATEFIESSAQHLKNETAVAAYGGSFCLLLGVIASYLMSIT